MIVAAVLVLGILPTGGAAEGGVAANIADAAGATFSMFSSMAWNTPEATVEQGGDAAAPTKAPQPATTLKLRSTDGSVSGNTERRRSDASSDIPSSAAGARAHSTAGTDESMFSFQEEYTHEEVMRGKVYLNYVFFFVAVALVGCLLALTGMALKVLFQRCVSGLAVKPKHE